MRFPRVWPFRRLDLDEADFREEIRAHLAADVRERIESGADPEQARYQALREFGNVTLATEAARRVWTPAWLERWRDLWRDVGHGVRSLRRTPGFTLTVLAVLALGIGVNATVFAIVKSLALAPIAGVEGSGRLGVVYRETASGRKLRLSYPDFADLRARDDAFMQLMGTTVSTFGLGREHGSRSVWGEMVTGNYFDALGLRPQVGRALQPQDEVAPGRHPVVVISDGFWKREFGADPDVAGRVLRVNDVPFTIVGVAPEGFHGTVVSYDVELFLPIMMAPALGFALGSSGTTAEAILSDRAGSVFEGHGFLRPGVSLATASSRLSALWESSAAERPVPEIKERLRAVSYLDKPGTGPTYLLPTVFALGVMGLLVLSIACANLAGLVLVRGLSRRAEIAMRLALGATRIRLVRLLVIESLIVAVPGALIGILIASAGLPLLLRYAEGMAAPQRVYLNLTVDWTVIAFAVGVACACALTFGLVPAIRASRLHLATAANALSTRIAPRSRTRGWTVSAQVAVSVVLLVSAGLAGRSASRARAADMGFRTDGVTSIDLDVKQHGFNESRGREFYRRLLEVAGQPSHVEHVTLAAFNPLNFTDTRAQKVEIDGYHPSEQDDLALANNIVSPGYFEALRIPIVAGRALDSRDSEQGAPVMIVNQTLANQFFGGPAAAIGSRIRVGSGRWHTVVGVAADIKYLRINEAPRPYFYLSLFQAYRSTVTLHVQGTAPVSQLVNEATAAIRHVAPDMPILTASSLADRVGNSLFLLKFAAAMLLIFGGAGVVLAALGIYGLVSYTVAQSAKEISVRMTLGAQAAAVVRQFLGRGLRLGLTGVLPGLVCALVAGGLFDGLLFGVRAADPLSFVFAVSTVLASVLLASALPAWRASRTDPLQVLRHE